MAVSGKKNFLPGQNPLDRTASLPGEGRAERLQPRVNFPSVPTSHKGNDDPDLGLRQAEDIRKLPADRRGILGRRVHDQLPGRFPKRRCRVGLDVPVLDFGRGINILENLIGFFKSRIDIPVFYAVNAEDIAVRLEVKARLIEAILGLGARRMDNRRAGLHRLNGIENRRQRLVLHLNQVERFLGDVPFFRSHSRDDVTDVSYPVDGHDRLVLHDRAKVGIHAFEVVTGQDSHDSR